jgi:hypothetical protein
VTDQVGGPTTAGPVAKSCSPAIRVGPACTCRYAGCSTRTGSLGPVYVLSDMVTSSLITPMAVAAKRAAVLEPTAANDGALPAPCTTRSPAQLSGDSPPERRAFYQFHAVLMEP